MIRTYGAMYDTKAIPAHIIPDIAQHDRAVRRLKRRMIRVAEVIHTGCQIRSTTLDIAKLLAAKADTSRKGPPTDDIRLRKMTNEAYITHIGSLWEMMMCPTDGLYVLIRDVQEYANLIYTDVAYIDISPAWALCLDHNMHLDTSAVRAYAAIALNSLQAYGIGSSHSELYRQAEAAQAEVHAGPDPTSETQVENAWRAYCLPFERLFQAMSMYYKHLHPLVLGAGQLQQDRLADTSDSDSTLNSISYSDSDSDSEFEYID